MTLRVVVAVGLVGLCGAGCNLLAPTCLGRQERHSTETKTARIQAGEQVVLTLPDDTRGSQNDVEIDWSSRLEETRLTVYATRADCETGPDRAAGFSDRCRILSQGTGEGHAAVILTVTHGRGNPEVLGNPPAFKIWIYGDPASASIYMLTASSFYGPDC